MCTGISILMMHHYPGLGSASDWSCSVANLIQLIRRTTQICVVACYPYGISALVSQMSFGGETSGHIAKCWLFSQATKVRVRVRVTVRHWYFIARLMKVPDDLIPHLLYVNTL